jgi:hypothetical protein
MSTTEQTPAALDRVPENEDIAQLAALARRLNGELSVLSELTKEAAADSDIRAAAVRLAGQAGDLWNASRRLTQALGVESGADLELRVEAGIRTLEPLWIAATTLKETLPEVLDDLGRSGKLQELGAATAEWIEVAREARRLMQGVSPSSAARAQELLHRIESWAGQLAVLWETLVGTLPEVLRSPDLRQGLKDFGEAIVVWASVARESRALFGVQDTRALEARISKLIASMHEAQSCMRAVDKERGGLWGLLKLLFSPQTQYVLRCGIAGAYPVLKELSNQEAVQRS